MITETGIWTQDTADETHQSSEALASFLIGYLDKDKVTFDFGCGFGFYLSKLEQAGFTEGCLGVEGYKLNNFLNKQTLVWDLTTPVNISDGDGNKITGNVISLEVGEHLPKEAQETFIQTVTGY